VIKAAQTHRATHPNTPEQQKVEDAMFALLLVLNRCDFKADPAIPEAFANACAAIDPALPNLLVLRRAEQDFESMMQKRDARIN
jgi:hypothetical protein